ncbi:MAG: hypothetical protein Q8900_09975 [Bacillota bacterium]|nr:hypothetical protein [Bacillota bacterium]
MGNYNPQYESYYNNMINRKKSNNSYKGNLSNNNSYNHKGSLSNNNYLSGNYFIKRIIRELVCTLLLFVFVIVCRTVHTQKTIEAYNYSKSVINEDYNYKNIIDYAKNIKLSSLQKDITNWMDSIQSKISSSPASNDKIFIDH